MERQHFFIPFLLLQHCSAIGGFNLKNIPTNTSSGHIQTIEIYRGQAVQRACDLTLPAIDDLQLDKYKNLPIFLLPSFADRVDNKKNKQQYFYDVWKQDPNRSANTTK